jgi:hypothetical protein
MSTRLVGPDITDTSNTQGFALGTEYEDVNRTTYRYVFATAARTRYQPYFIDSTHKIHSLAVQSMTAGVSSPVIGVPQVAFAAPATGFSNRFGWVAVKGPFLASTVAALGSPMKTATWSTGGFGSNVTYGSVIPGLTARSAIAATAVGGMFAQNYMIPTLA